MKRILFNTHTPNEAAALFYRQGIASIPGIQFSNWKDYDKFDVALFMQHQSDLAEIAKARQINPKLQIGIVDPRGVKLLPYLEAADFCVVNSIEKKDFFAGSQSQVFIYYEYPFFERTLKRHQQKKPTIIGYHGNKVHLAAIFTQITRALEMLGKKHSIEFWAIYNIHELGLWNAGLPEGVPVKHHQWDQSTLPGLISQMDIGVVPTFQPFNNLQRAKRKSELSRKYFLDRDEDYLLRFKVPTNPGRISVFARQGVPVVSDFFPSACQFIEDGVSGYLACHTGGWYRSLDALVSSPALRQSMAERLDAKLNPVLDFNSQNERFLKFLDQLPAKPAQTPQEIIPWKTPTFSERLKFKFQIWYDISIGRHRRKWLKLKKLTRERLGLEARRN